MQKYQIIDKIGEGAYGIVLKCRINDPQSLKRKNTNPSSNSNNKYADIVAMKQFKDSDQNEVVKRTTMREVKVLKMLDHPNIVQLKEAFRKRGFVYLIFQYVRNNLLEVLQKTPDGIDHELIKVLMYQLIKGLAYLHCLNIIHRDIKPQNLLISQQNQLKICDFGFARVYKKTSKQQLTDYVATRWYRSPELLVGAHYNKEIDMWAAGCIMGELIDGNPMFPGQNQLDQLFLIQKCLGPLTSDQHQIFLKNPRFVGTKFPQIHSLETIDKRYAGKFSSKGLSFLKGLVKMNPSERMTATQALKHPYFQGLQQQESLRKSLMVNFIRNDSKITQKQQSNSPHLNNSTNNGKKNSFHSTVYHHESQRQKTQHSNYQQNDNIFGVFKVQKLSISKKKKQDNFINSKGASNPNANSIQSNNMSNSNNSTNANTNSTSNSSGSKSLGRSKVGTKMTHKQYPRRISLQKVGNRQVQTKTQTGFYIYGGSIIPQRLDEDQQSAHYIQPQQMNNRIYNVRSPKSRNNVRKQTNLNTQQIMEEDGDGVWQSTGQLPFLMPIPHKGSDKHQNHKGQAQGYIAPTNIIITNSTFNYRHGH